jgi:hypothetical protein
LRNKAQGWRAEGVKKLKIAEIRCRKSLIPKGRRVRFGWFFQFFHTFAAPTLGKAGKTARSGAGRPLPLWRTPANSAAWGVTFSPVCFCMGV